MRNWCECKWWKLGQMRQNLLNVHKHNWVWRTTHVLLDWVWSTTHVCWTGCEVLPMYRWTGCEVLPMYCWTWYIVWKGCEKNKSKAACTKYSTMVWKFFLNVTILFRTVLLLAQRMPVCLTGQASRQVSDHCCWLFWPCSTSYEDIFSVWPQGSFRGGSMPWYEAFVHYHSNFQWFLTHLLLLSNPM